MATGGASAEESGLLTGSDRVSNVLLSHVSEYIIPEKRKHFALSLGLSAAQFSHIEVNFPGNSQRINLEILESWHNNTPGLNVGLFMEKMVARQQSGYLSNEVWSSMGRYVIPGLFPEQPTPQTVKPTIDFIQKRLRTSLRGRCRNKLSTDWLPSDTAHRFDLREHFVELKQRKKVKRALRQTAENIWTIHDILKVEVAEGGVNIALRGEAGIGKSSSMAILASDWVEGESCLTKRKTRLAQFCFVFLVGLNDVKDNSTLAQIIMDQHDLQNIPESLIRSILEGEHGKVLLLLDGYDEYKEGTNNEIDRAIESTVGDCFLIVTSREGDYMSKETLAKIDGEIEITGFSEAGIEKCAAKYLNSADLAKDFTAKCKEAGIYGLLRVPIILLMTAVLFVESKESKEQLPKSLTEIVRRIVFLMIDRCTQKHFEGKKWHEIVGLEHLLKRLGEISLEALKNGNLRISKDDVMKISPDLLKLGLLHGTFLDEASLDGRPVMMTYPHKLFLEFMAAYFALSRVGCDRKNWSFNLLDKSMRTVATFMYGLAEDKNQLLRKVGDFIELLVDEVETFCGARPLLESFSKEDSSETNPLYNAYICSMNDYLPQPDVHSALYVFDESLPVQWKEEVGRTTALPMYECLIWIYYKTDSYLYKLIQTVVETGRTIKQLRLWQIGDTVTDEEEVQTMRPLQLEFSDDADVMLRDCDMRSYTLQGILQCAPVIRDLELDYVRHVPETVFSLMGQMRKLQTLRIVKGHYVVELCKELCTLLTKLPNLECFGLSGEPTHDDDQPLSFEERVQIVRTFFSPSSLKKIFLYRINISGVLTEACRDTSSRLDNLEVIVLNYVQLTGHDILSLENHIQGDNMPVLHELYLQGNNFINCQVALEKLLRTVDHKLPNCRVFVSPDKLPVLLLLDTNFSCLRVQTGPKGLDVQGTSEWPINPS